MNKYASIIFIFLINVFDATINVNKYKHANIIYVNYNVFLISTTKIHVRNINNIV